MRNSQPPTQPTGPKPTFVDDGRPKTASHGRFMIGEGISVELVWVTPELAKWILDNINTSNPRTISPRQVMKLRAEMLRVGVVTTGESMIFSKAGLLLDGQHRLSAIAAQEVSGWCLFVYGIADSARGSIDTAQKIRNIADILSGFGVKNSSTVAALGRMCFLSIVTPERGLNALFSSAAGTTLKSSAPDGNQDIAKWIWPRADTIREIYNAALRCGSRSVLGGTNLIAFGPTYSALMSHGTSAANDAMNASLEFLNGLGAVAGLTQGDPRTALLRYQGIRNVMRGKSKKGNQEDGGAASGYRDHLLKVCLLAWNAWIEGREMSRLTISPNWVPRVSTYAETRSVHAPH